MRPPAPRGAGHQDAPTAIVRPHLARAHLDCQRLPGMSETEPDLETAAKLKTHGDRYEMLARARPGVRSRQRGSGRSGIGKADLPRQQQTMPKGPMASWANPLASPRRSAPKITRWSAYLRRLRPMLRPQGLGRQGTLEARASLCFGAEPSLPRAGDAATNTIWCVATP
jgi:hypothetical protein